MNAPSEDVERDPSQRLRDLRTVAHLSQRQIAREFGVTSGAIAQWENGSREVPKPIVRLIEIYETEFSESHRDVKIVPSQAPVDGWLKRSAAATQATVPWLFARAFVGHRNKGILSNLRDDAVQRFVTHASRMKGLPMKWAQMMWAMEPLLAPEERAAMHQLRRAPAVLSPEKAAVLFLEEFGATPRQAFAHWQSTPLAAGSVGQVHKAQSLNGKTLAVKIQYPTVRNNLRQDLRNIEILDQLTPYFFRRQTAGVLHQELCDRYLEECDYRLEASYQKNFRQLFAGDEEVIIPAIEQAYSSERVLTSEYVEGQTLEEFCASATHAQKNKAAATIWRFFYTSVLKHGVFNTDPHPGNFLFLNGKVAFLDFGRMKRLSPRFVELWKMMGRAIFERDESKVRHCLVELEYAPPSGGFDFRPTLTFLWRWTEPCLSDRFEFTPDYLKRLWASYLGDTSRRDIRLLPEQIFLPQLLFGVASIMVTLNATLSGKQLAAELFFEKGEQLPPPYSAEELAASL